MREQTRPRRWRWYRGRAVVLVAGSDRDGTVDAVDTHGRLLTGVPLDDCTIPSNPLTTIVMSWQQAEALHRAEAAVTGPGVARG